MSDLEVARRRRRPMPHSFSTYFLQASTFKQREGVLPLGFRHVTHSLSLLSSIKPAFQASKISSRRLSPLSFSIRLCVGPAFGETGLSTPHRLSSGCSLFSGSMAGRRSKPRCWNCSGDCQLVFGPILANVYASGNGRKSRFPVTPEPIIRHGSQCRSR